VDVRSKLSKGAGQNVTKRRKHHMGTDNRKMGDELDFGVLGGMFSGQANFDRKTLKEHVRLQR
jgi:hypothetical protein